MPARTPVSMGFTPQEKIDQAEEMSSGPSPEDMVDYPYGLRIHLSHEELQKLGYASEGLTPGTRVALVGYAVVKDASAEQVNTMTKRNASLQITDLAVEAAPEETDRAAALYGGADK